ncbi:MAG: hypothetical protein LUG85_03065 [Clostridiales bacterium]|nr:hypothetical protein [Clostridiales bacterium]
MKTMKKFLSIFLMLALVFSAFTMGVISVSAATEPELMLAADYNAESGTVTLLYRVLNFVGVESADFRLQFDSSVLELKEQSEITTMQNVIIEAGVTSDSSDIFAIQFVDLYCVEESDCDEDESATVIMLTFAVTDTAAESLTFTASCPDCYMDPDSTEITLDSVSLDLSLTAGSVQTSTEDGYDVSELISSFNGGESADESEDETAAADSSDSEDREKIKKVVIAAIVTAVVLVVGIIAVVIKYRKDDK